jgi:transposase
VGQRQSYSKEFKDSVRSKILSRGNRTIAEICEEAGVATAAASNWIRQYGSSSGMKKQKSSSQWNPEQKLKALIETASLSEAELGTYLRKEGLFSAQLDDWRSEFLSSMTSQRKLKNPKKDERDKKIVLLEREILRKDKALAEAAALLILQKKVHLLWGIKNEDEA